MADTLLWSQEWTAGNSTCMQVTIYERFAPRNDPADPLYPEMYASAQVEVSGGMLQWWDNPGSSTDRWSGAGVRMRVPSVAAPGLAMPDEGYAVVHYKPNSQSLTAPGQNSYAPLLVLADTNSSFAGRFQLTASWLGSGTWGLELQWDNGAEFDDSYTFTSAAVQDQDVLFKIYWKRNVSFQVYMKIGAGAYVLAYDKPWAESEFFIGGQILQVMNGYAGLWGPTDYTRIYSVTTEPTPDPPDAIFDTNLRCCGDEPSQPGSAPSEGEPDTTEPPVWDIGEGNGEGVVPEEVTPPNGAIQWEM